MKSLTVENINILNILKNLYFMCVDVWIFALTMYMLLLYMGNDVKEIWESEHSHCYSGSYTNFVFLLVM